MSGKSLILSIVAVPVLYVFTMPFVSYFAIAQENGWKRGGRYSIPRWLTHYRVPLEWLMGRLPDEFTPIYNAYAKWCSETILSRIDEMVMGR